MILVPLKKNLLLSFFAFFFSLGILNTNHWDFALLFALSIVVSYQWLYERSNHWLYLLIAGIIGASYAYLCGPFSWPFFYYLLLGALVLTYEKGIKWRRIPYIKPVFIAICWFSLGIAIPKLVLYGKLPIVDFSHLFLFFILAVVEDLEDMSEDIGHIRTIPLLLTKVPTELLIVFSLFGYFAMNHRLNIFSEHWEIKYLSIILANSPLIYAVYLKNSQKINHQYFDFLLFLVGLLYLL